MYIYIYIQNWDILKAHVIPFWLILDNILGLPSPWTIRVTRPEVTIDEGMFVSGDAQITMVDYRIVVQSSKIKL